MGEEPDQLVYSDVQPTQLNYYHTPETYDDDIERSIPGYEKLHEHIEQLCRTYQFAQTGIELGVGTGKTAEVVLGVCQQIDYSVIDFCKPLLDLADERLGKGAHYIHEDYTNIRLPKTDLVVSVIGMHHVIGKKELFERIYGSLNEGGGFILGDLMTYKDPKQAAKNDFLHAHHLVEHARDEKQLVDWANHHKNLNNLMPHEDIVDWLEEVGFKNVVLAFQQYNTMLIHARK